MAPENTFEAVQKTIELGVPGLEIDLRSSIDGQLYCFHDENLKRLCGVKGKPDHLTSEQLRQLKVHTTHDHQKLQGRFLFLEELLDLSQGKVLLNIELKGSRRWTSNIVRHQLLAPIKARNMLNNVLFSSFFHAPLKRVLKMEPDAKAGFLIHPTHYRLGKPGWSSKWMKLFSIHPPVNLATPEHIESWKNQGYGVYVWTVNKMKEYEELTQLGVDGIITDIAEKFIERQEINHE